MQTIRGETNRALPRGRRRARAVVVPSGSSLGNKGSATTNTNTDSATLPLSRLTLGTMFFGASIPAEDAYQQLSYAYDHGVVAFDTAEMYPVPQSAATQGASERVLGGWLKANGKRIKDEDVHVATKVAGPGAMTWLRGGPTRLDGENIGTAIDGSLERLGRDRIDLLLLHWPDRYVPMFGADGYDVDLAYGAYCSFEEQLEGVERGVAAGKVGSWGLSNETAYGLARFCEVARARGWSKPTCVQNAYNLLCRTAESSLVEALHVEGVGLMAYSPLAMGLLGGAYTLDGASWSGEADKRLVKYRGRYAEAESRYGPKANVAEAVAAYVGVAREHGLAPVELALRFVLSHRFVGTAVVGAASVGQLEAQIAYARRGGLDETVLRRVDEVHRRFPNPCP